MSPRRDLALVSLCLIVCADASCTAPPLPVVEDVPYDRAIDAESARDVVAAIDGALADGAGGADAAGVGDGARAGDASSQRDFCSTGRAVPGLASPPGFCVRKYSNVRVARVMAIAPNGDLFVSAPTRASATGISGGPGAIIVLSDDDGDGVIEERTFATGIADVHGLAFSEGFLYFTNGATVLRTPYRAGQREETAGARQFVIGGMVPDGMGGMRVDPESARFGTGGRDTHGMARSSRGTIYVTRGEYSSCNVGPGGVREVGTGEVYRLGMHSLDRVLFGFRNPMYARCHFSRELCMVSELGEDNVPGAIEKLLVIPSSPAWFGYPCCHQRDVGPQASSGGCADVRVEEVSIPMGDTPFGFDWERGLWPEPYRNGVFVALHGSFYRANFAGAAVVYLPTDPTTGAPRRQAAVPFLETTNGSANPSLQRPTDVVFASDGRMFVSDDYGGGVYMVAPIVR